MQKIPAKDFYEEYHGHTVPHLRHLLTKLRQQGIKSFIYLAGDSTLDNKHWLFDPNGKSLEGKDFHQKSASAALNGYEHVLEPPVMMRDVSYWVNYERLG